MLLLLSNSHHSVHQPQVAQQRVVVNLQPACRLHPALALQTVKNQRTMHTLCATQARHHTPLLTHTLDVAWAVPTLSEKGKHGPVKMVLVAVKMVLGCAHTEAKGIGLLRKINESAIGESIIILQPLTNAQQERVQQGER